MKLYILEYFDGYYVVGGVVAFANNIQQLEKLLSDQTHSKVIRTNEEELLWYKIIKELYSPQGGKMVFRQDEVLGFINDTVNMYTDKGDIFIVG